MSHIDKPRMYTEAQQWQSRLRSAIRVHWPECHQSGNATNAGSTMFKDGCSPCSYASTYKSTQQPTMVSETKHLCTAMDGKVCFSSRQSAKKHNIHSTCRIYSTVTVEENR